MQPNSGQWEQNPQPAHGQPPQPQIIGQQIMVGETQSTNAMIGLILGILGIIGSFFYGIGCLCGTIGLIITYGAKKITDLNPMHPDKGTVTAALITNWIAVILAILMLITVALAGVMYVWAASLANEQVEDYDATDTSSNTLNTYTAEDTADDAWEPGEYILLSEADAEICSSSGCMVDIFVTSSGNTVAGDQTVIVN